MASRALPMAGAVSRTELAGIRDKMPQGDLLGEQTGPEADRTWKPAAELGTRDATHLAGLINAANWSFNDEQVFVLRKQILRAYRQLEAKKSQDAKNPPFKVYVYDEEEVPQLKPLLRSQIYCSRGQWGTDVQVHDYFVTSNCQTDDPKEADFFFVPGYAICVLEGLKRGLPEPMLFELGQ
ncbi:unnamed protein product [Effrenium voratum]|uniref:Exostosin GT47 domain-containing protein n=1 Tax=Effrenium voratum TaxID=2562239 RepID=A0AA36HNK4_9DINO|nr:unnamed protein product [Effrenium voratum]